MNTDDTTTIGQLKRLVADFVARRDWRRFHAPKNLAMSLAIETAELMEHFQWTEVEESRLSNLDTRTLEAVGAEIADVFCYLLAMANELELELADITRRKLAANERKYPVEQYHGRYRLDNENPDEAWKT